jgi:hypothetical protein
MGGLWAIILLNRSKCLKRAEKKGGKKKTRKGRKHENRRGKGEELQIQFQTVPFLP